MFRGIVKFSAAIKGEGVTFPAIVLKASELGIEKVEVEGQTGSSIQGTVHIASVLNQEEGRFLATKVIVSTLNRISFLHCLAIENHEITGEDFSPMNGDTNVFVALSGSYGIRGFPASMPVGIVPDTLKAKLERASLPGEAFFNLFRSARLSLSPVEEFVTLYNILLMVCGDSPAKVDAFVRSVDPRVPQTPDPRPGYNHMETVYSRLRNELAHPSRGANLDVTKAEMAQRVGKLAALTKRAIESHGRKPVG